jgi:hypothetical protein
MLTWPDLELAKLPVPAVLAQLAIPSDFCCQLKMLGANAARERRAPLPGTGGVG